MAEAGTLFERFIQAEAVTYPIVILEEQGNVPAFVVQAKLFTDEQERRLRDKHTRFPKPSKREANEPRNQKKFFDKSYFREWMERVVENWEGLTKENLSRLVVGFRWQGEEDLGQAELELQKYPVRKRGGIYSTKRIIK